VRPSKADKSVMYANEGYSILSAYPYNQRNVVNFTAGSSYQQNSLCIQKTFGSVLPAASLG